MEIIFEILKSILLLVQRRADERRAQRVEIKKKFKESSDNLCSCIASGSESIKAIQDYLAKREPTVPDSPDYSIIKDCTNTVSTFNKAQTEFFSVLDDLCLINRDPQGYEEQKYSLLLLLEEYAHDIQDTTYVTKLSQGVDTTFEGSNSELLKNIITLFDRPQDNLGDIVLLRFKNDKPKDYYTEVQKICGNFAEMVKLPYKNDYQIIASPFKAGLGDSEQMYRLGVLFLQQGNRKQAVRWLEKAIEKGHLEAHLELGKLLLKEGKTEAGLMLLHNASDHGHEDSMLELGHYYADHKEIKMAIECFSRLSDHRRDAKYYLAEVYDEENDLKDGIGLYAELVGTQNKPFDIYSFTAMCRIVEASDNERISKIDTSAVLDYYERVNAISDQGVVFDDHLYNQINEILILFLLQYACFLSLFKLYEHANVVYLELVKRNSPAAQCRMGLIYEFGLGVQEDDDLAKYYYRLSAGQHYPDAYAELGRYLIQRECDYEYGLNYLFTAADHHVRNAYYLLVQFYCQGIPAKVGKGIRTDGIKYEKLYHTTSSRYYYVSLLDHSISESSLVDGYLDLAHCDGDPLFWWKRKEKMPDYDQMTENASNTNRLIDVDDYYAVPFIPGDKSKTWKLPDDDVEGEFILSVIRGSVRFSVVEKQTDGLLQTIDISSQDEVYSLYIDGVFCRVEFAPLEAGTIIRYKLETLLLKKASTTTA